VVSDSSGTLWFWLWDVPPSLNFGCLVLPFLFFLSFLQHLHPPFLLKVIREGTQFSRMQALHGFVLHFVGSFCFLQCHEQSHDFWPLPVVGSFLGLV
jgi:hypothetical protein